MYKTRLSFGITEPLQSFHCGYLQPKERYTGPRGSGLFLIQRNSPMSVLVSQELVAVKKAIDTFVYSVK